MRDTSGVWMPEQARQLLSYTERVGGEIAAAEFFNEPTMPEYGGAPPGYDAADYARDFAAFLTCGGRLCARQGHESGLVSGRQQRRSDGARNHQPLRPALDDRAGVSRKRSTSSGSSTISDANVAPGASREANSPRWRRRRRQS
ncbi:hypothetical protein Nham_3972 [Nitrobacter hamburgensis X14]|uniref:Uncharacterized protein n=1 Tax=Nitrobacter hamburgensis (strain DSM 10229 / NCIMB 13809 / X14) TaxID=323097 RepID=Q1QGK0_NITHX|nr:hypothetical protein Nham_3972 [Nitrobacter hamburgensis X14]